LSANELDRFHAEGAPVAALYGADNAPRSAADLQALFAEMAPKLERSDVVFDFFQIVRAAPLLPLKAAAASARTALWMRFVCRIMIDNQRARWEYRRTHSSGQYYDKNVNWKMTPKRPITPRFDSYFSPLRRSGRP
jgi:uncharacterized protein (DUF2236 family)